ncbi:hypothetical protein [Cellulomonas wangsupingiae]|uniref:Uncharacterized protein n=1 Tax=Cellulomonas wangsupingiae TaxID=2968085 RepID=A0ABY5K8T5_9CELL|nr:hypothetical protein [Cellulomonas wangsupingiae]UUI66872.1 hypothetical protein NP075_09275 [Cellulomonas wangsupingiae]
MHRRTRSSVVTVRVSRRALTAGPQRAWAPTVAGEVPLQQEGS